MSFPGELVHASIGTFNGIHLFNGNPEKKTIAFIGVNNIDELYSFVKGNGWDAITEVSEPQHWGGRICFVTTIYGSILQFFE